MQRFLSERIAVRIKWIILFSLLTAYFLYFYFFNRFHLYYLEQTQLFRFSTDYFNAYISKPGEFVFYLGEFLSQFFVSPLAGALIVTGLAGAICYLSHLIFKKTGLHGLLWSLIPALMLASLQSDHLFKIGLSVGLVMALALTWAYSRISNHRYRYLLGAAGWLLLYHLGGGFALLASALILLLEGFYFRSPSKWFALPVIVLCSLALPYLGWKFIYLVPLRDAWLYPFPFWGVERMPLLGALLAYFPVMWILLWGVRTLRKKEDVVAPWNYSTLLGGSLVVLGGMALIQSKVYDPRVEIFLGMDHAVQKEDWQQVIKKSKSYEGPNQLVTYYTNLALYKTGQLGDRLFEFPQTGLHGLYLEWARDEVTPFFGGEVYYHLNYINEAYRWAFESMVVKGYNPRSLKRLVLTSIINGHYAIAEKYLNVLGQSMHYRKWVTHYRAYVTDPDKISQNRELASKRQFSIKNDFISRQLGLNELAKEHPENRMAFEYQMAIFLLNRDLAGFSENIYRIRELGYREIPVHYEEALLFSMTLFKKDLVPEGYSIRPSTLQRKEEYIAQIASCGGNRELAVSRLKKQFGNSCWYYLHFTSPTP